MITVTKQDICAAMKELGIKEGDILLFHSSLKSLGQVENGADTVIDGLLEAVGKTGTLVAPTLVQKDFMHAYENWNKDTSPSDVGLITETLRRRPEALRSNQATHSCAAIGAQAAYLTTGHETVGPRFHLYGDYAFSYGSPWQKMFDLGGKVLFLGVTTAPNTYRHFMEARLIERALNAIRDDAVRNSLKAELATYPQYAEYAHQLSQKAKNSTSMTLLSPHIDAKSMQKMEPILARCESIVRYGRCGNAKLILMDIFRMVLSCEAIVTADPEAYMAPEEADWFRRAWAAAEPAETL